MSKENKNEDEITEKIKIIATDDEKIKSFGELLTNDSSRAILQLLFNEELTALQIAERTGISLQLVKYHIIKLQDLGVVKVTKIEKNSKSQDMKFYSASKFSMVIVPPKYSEKTKESKLLVRSFKHIYKIAGLGIAAGLSGLMSLSLLQPESIVPVEVREQPESQKSEFQDMDESLQSSLRAGGEDAAEESSTALAPVPSAEPSPEAEDYMLDESLELAQRPIEEPIVNPTIGPENPIFNSGDLAITFMVLAIIFGGLAAFFLFKSIRKSKQRQIA